MSSSIKTAFLTAAAFMFCGSLNAQISNGAAGAGALSITPDTLGAWNADFNTGGNLGESFTPTGLPADYPTFSVGSFIFVSNTHRELLSLYVPWQNTSGNGGAFGSDLSLTTTILSNLSYADWAYGDSTNDTAMSSYRVTGAGVNLHVQLTQAARRSSTAGVGFVVQKYTIRNDDGASLSFKFHRAWDVDMFWRTGAGNDYENDEVGAGMYGGHRYVRQGEVGLNAATCCLSGIDQPTSYYGAKRTHTPTNGGPAFGYGTDNPTWNNYGTPATWKNYVAYVGYDTDGLCGDRAGQDAHIAIEYEVTLASGESRDFYIIHTYGSTTPAICHMGDVNADGIVNDDDLLDVLFGFGGVGLGDVNLDGIINDDDLLGVLFGFGIAC